MTTPTAFQLTPAEIQSGQSRVKWAEALILQLPADHEGRNSWLLNYANGRNGATATEALDFVPPPCKPTFADPEVERYYRALGTVPPADTPDETAHDALVARFNHDPDETHSFCLPVTPCSAHGCGSEDGCAYPDCSRPDPLDPVRLAVQNLLDAAMTARRVVTIERKANTDGTRYYEVDTRGIPEDYRS